MKNLAYILITLGLANLASAQSLPDLSGLASKDTMDSLSQMAGGSMSDALQGQLGMTEDQAEGSLGSLLSLASENLSAGNFDKLAGMIPGADGYMDAAKSLGAVTSPLKSLDDLNNALASLGIGPETVQKFVPMITEYVGKLGGEDAAALLSQALGG